MKCPNCGTEGNFEWATTCRCCRHSLDSIDPSCDPKNSLTEPTDRIKIQPQKERAIEIQDEEKIEFTSIDPMDYAMGVKKATGENESPDDIKPMPMENELTLYHDSNLKLTVSEEGKAATFTVTKSKDDIEQINVSEAASELIESDKAEMQDSQTNIETKDENPSTDEMASTPEEPCQPESSKTENEPANDIQPPKTDKIVNLANVLSDSNLAHPKHSPGVVYISGKNLTLTGGIKVSPGDEINISDQTFVVKAKKSRGMLFYAIIGAVAVVIIISLLIFGAGSSQGDGQLVGTIANPIDGKALSGVPVKISELNKTAVTSQAGFFTFTGIPTGIYTLVFNTVDNRLVQERITVLKNQITTVALKETPKAPESVQNSPEVNKPVSTANKENSSKGASGLLKLTLSPNNASAYIDGKPIGIGSHAYKLAPGDYTLTVSKTGYADKTQGITIEPDRALSLKISLAEESQSSSPAKSEVDLGYEQETAGNYGEALKHYNAAIQRNIRDVAALLGQARCYKAQNLNDNAIASYMVAAKTAENKQDINSQIEAYTGVITIKPNTYTAYSSRGDLLYRQGQYSKAADDFSKVIELDNRNLTAYYKLGNSYYYGKEYQAALKTFLAAQELNFADPKAEAYIAKTYLAMGDKKNSKKAYERFKELATYPARLEFKRDPEWQNVLNALGVEY